MDNIEMTPMGWAKDKILTGEIGKILDSTDGSDYIYTISVQGHGDYPAEYPEGFVPEITVTGFFDTAKEKAFTYYVNQIHEMDNFVKELTDTLAEYPEPVVLVMYGDHLPTMGLETKDVDNPYLFQTQYVMWDNMGLEKKDKNLSSYQMAAEVFDRVGIHDGTIFRYHQTRRNTKNYQVDLEVLQYDLLYGNQYAYGGETPYQKTNMTLGVLPVTMKELTEIGENAYSIAGENFTASSKLEINGKLIEDTIFISSNLLMVRDVELNFGDKIDVAQQSNSSTKRVLSRSAAFIYREAALLPTPTPEPVETQTPLPASTQTDVPPEQTSATEN